MSLFLQTMTNDICCKICGDVFGHTQGLKKHLGTVHNTDENGDRIKYPCTDCEKVFESRVGLKEHHDDIHLNKKFPCPECTEVLDTIQKRTYHVNKVHRKKKFTCEECGATPASKQNLENHMMTIHQIVLEDEHRESKKQKVSNVEIVVSDVQKFIDNISEIMKDSGDPSCFHQLCTVTKKVGYGIPGGDKISCNKHKDEHPEHSLVRIGHLCAYIGCLTKGTINIKDTRYRFCSKHNKILLEMGMQK